MSKGLGRIQQGVLDMLAATGRHCTPDRLAALIYHRDAFTYQGEFDARGEVRVTVTRAEYVAVTRALKTLAGKGLVTLTRHKEQLGGTHETQHISLEGEHYTVVRRGGTTHYATARLSVDCVSSLKRNQHLTG